ncbi:hypothetical protein MMC22_005409 [Lobaria immixta]|nr:hypothetical protein [Lobaria immixta]
MPSTADRGLVLSHEYSNSVHDYIGIGFSTRDLHDGLFMKGHKQSCIDHGAAFSVMYDPPNTFDPNLIIWLYSFGPQGQLSCPDVEEKDAAHQKKVYSKISEEIPVEEKSEETSEIMKQLLKKLAPPIYYKQGDVPEDEKNLAQEKRERYTVTLMDLKELVREKSLTTSIISCILTAKIVEEKEEILNLFSGQTSYPTKQPVRLLISLVDSNQTNEVGEAQGWITAYDFIKDLLLIKRFVMKEGQISCPETSHGDVAQDGWGKTFDFSNANHHDGFKMMAHTRAAKWIDFFGASFESVYGPEFHAHRLALQEPMAKVKKAITEEITFPILETIDKHHMV